jgi:hypothetical protein
VKSREEFNKDLSRKDGLASHCRECRNGKRRQRWKDNPELNQERNRQWRKDNQYNSKMRAGRLVHDAITRDRKRDFPTPNTSRIKAWKKEVAKLIEAGRCEATGVEFDLSPPKKGQLRNPRSPSIDKINPKKPYLPTRGPRNWRLVTTAYNLARAAMSDDEHVEIVVDPLILSRGANPYPLWSQMGQLLHTIGNCLWHQTMFRLLIPLRGYH